MNRHIRDWGRDIHDLASLIADLERAPGLIIEASINDLQECMFGLAEVIRAAQLRILRRQ